MENADPRIQPILTAICSHLLTANSDALAVALIKYASAMGSCSVAALSSFAFGVPHRNVEQLLRELSAAVGPDADLQQQASFALLEMGTNRILGGIDERY